MCGGIKFLMLKLKTNTTIVIVTVLVGVGLGRASLAAEESSLNHILELEAFQSTTLQSDGNCLSGGIGVYPTFFTWKVLRVGLGGYFSIQKKITDGDFFAASLFGHVGATLGSFALDGQVGISDWLSYGGTALEVGGRVSYGFDKKILYVASGLYASFTHYFATDATQQIQVGFLMNF